MSTKELIDRLKDFKAGELISFNIGGNWFIQYVESTSGELCKTPYIWCKRIGQLPHKFLLVEENKTWIRGVHESILGKSA